MDFGAGAVEIARGFEVTHAQHAVFYRSDTVDAPLVVGDGLGKLALDRCLRVEAVYDFFGESLVGVHVFGGEHDDARSEAVAKGVHAGTGIPLRGRGTVGFFGIETIGCVLSG